MNKDILRTLLVLLGGCVNIVLVTLLSVALKGPNNPKDFVVLNNLNDSLVIDTNVVHNVEVIDSIKIIIDSNFNYVFPKFKVFNKNIDSVTVKKFVDVMNTYGLDKTDKHREMYSGQILLESGAKQYRSNGDLVVSSAGCIGLCQIMPSTALGYMRKHADTADIKVMGILGAGDFSFAFADTLSNSQKIVKTREWLSDVTNNIIMWGFITKRNLDKIGDITTQLVSYNMGSSGANKYIANGGDINQHKYIKGIQSKLLVAN